MVAPPPAAWCRPHHSRNRRRSTLDLLARRGQLRHAPSGHAIGIDLPAALRLTAARGCNLEVLSELLPAAEVGLVAALSASGDQSG